MKQKLFLDFDGVIVDSVKAYCDLYNEEFKVYKNFNKANYKKVNKWNFSDQCPLAVSYIENMFSSYKFFDLLKLMDNNTIQIIKELQNKYKVIVCSIGTPENISYKASWIKDILNIDDMILIAKNNAAIGKSIIDMSESIIIDDHEDNLITSNANMKICFGETKSWNKNWKGIRVNNWSELKEFLL